MRTAGLLALAILLPSLVVAAALININTADAVLLDTLPGIGPTIATRIIDYRTAHGPFARIEDIQNVSGIGPSTYANISPLITVGDSSVQNTTPVASSTETTTSSGGAATYIPPPAALSLDAGPDTVAHLEVPLTLTAVAKAKGGAIDLSARVYWSFGDGSSGEGSTVEKTYHYAGTYLVVATAKDGSTVARDDVVVVAKPALARIVSVTKEGIVIANDTGERLDLSGWRLVTDTGLFRFPEGTALLQNSNVLFPYAIMNLPVAFTAELAYPDGVVAARYSPAVASPAPLPPPVLRTVSEQPIVASTGSLSIQAKKTSPINSPKANLQKNEKAARAPASTVEPAAVGAALAPLSTTTKSSAAGLFRSPWTLSLFGVIAAAGSAFILL